MKSDYFEKIQKRYDELTDKGAAIELGGQFWLSLKDVLPDVPQDTYCTDRFMVRFHERAYDDFSIKTLSYRRYYRETGKWSDWKDNEFDFSSFLNGVTFQGKKIYILNLDNGHNNYNGWHLTMYAPELSQKTYVLKDDNSKEVKILPWVYIDVQIGTADDGLSYPNSPVVAHINTWHMGSRTYEEARRYFAKILVDGYSEAYHIKRGEAELHPRIIEEVEDCLDEGILPEEIVNAPIHPTYADVMFTPAQGLRFADERLPILEHKLEEITPEWKRLKAILDMSPEEKEKFIQEEEKKEKEQKRQKAAERAAKKAEKEALDKKKSILMWMGLGVIFITLLLCLIPTLISDSKFLQTIMIAAIITIVVVIWKAVKKTLKRKWGIKDEE